MDVVYVFLAVDPAESVVAGTGGFGLFQLFDQPVV